MQKLIVGNWKCNKSTEEVLSWRDAVRQSGQFSKTKKFEVVLCPPTLYLPLLVDQIPGLQLGAQTVSAYPNGAYTGAISATMLSQYVKYAILGHAERRKYFGETCQSVAQEARQCFDAGITPIIGLEASSAIQQLSLLDSTELNQTVVMYEPAEAISTSAHGQAADLTAVIEAITALRQEFPVKAILYGGSVSAANVAEYISAPSIDGVVPGAASLDSEAFIQLLRNADAAISES